MKQTLIAFFKKTLLLAFVILVALYSLSIPLSKQDIPEVTEDFYLNDYVGLIEDYQKKQILENARSFYDEYDFQIVITLIKELNHHKIAEISAELFKEYNLSENGLLVLYSMNENELYIQVGKEVEPYMASSLSAYFAEKYVIGDNTGLSFSNKVLHLQGALIHQIKYRIEEINENPASMNIMEEPAKMDPKEIVFILTIIALIIFSVVKSSKK